MNETLVVNLFGGPCTGKSTMAADIFTALKRSQIRCELVTEYAKDKVWEDSAHVLNDQIYVFAKQNHRIRNLLGKVDVVICDSPLLISGVYAEPRMDHLLYLSFDRLVRDVFSLVWNLNIYVNRDTVYDPVGRVESLPDAVKVDYQIVKYLDTHDIPYMVYYNNPGDVRCVVDKIHGLVG